MLFVKGTYFKCAIQTINFVVFRCRSILILVNEIHNSTLSMLSIYVKKALIVLMFRILYTSLSFFYIYVVKMYFEPIRIKLLKCSVKWNWPIWALYDARDIHVISLSYLETDSIFSHHRSAHPMHKILYLATWS